MPHHLRFPLTKKYSDVGKVLPNWINADRRLCYGQMMLTVFKTRQCISRFHFFMSSNGYGMFMHTTTPITCDFGVSFNSVNTMMIGDDQLDLFIFLGSPKEILNEYTNITGKSPMPPLWSFGLWMSRITYSSEKQVRDVSAKLIENRIPCDVIHLDVGWFETDWRTDYKFSTTRFSDPAKMISDLKKVGHRISLWQLPYFVPKNRLFPGNYE